MGEGSGERLLKIFIMSNLFYHLKIALRNLRRDGIYSVINVGGLAVSLAAVILIALWVTDELSYDRFHRNADELYLVNTQWFDGPDWRTPLSLLPAVTAELPEIAGGCRVRNANINYLEYEGRRFYEERVAFVDSSFFTIFDFSLVAGDFRNPFPDDESVVLSKSTAGKIFGDEDPSGKILTLFGGQSVHVAGVMNDLPRNSSIGEYTVLFPERILGGSWRNFHIKTYLRLRPGVDAAALNEKMADVVRKNRSYDGSIILQPLTDVHLYQADGKAGSALSAVRLFSVIALSVLIIACINYVNLVTARAGKRSREMGLRKVTGASRFGLFGQLMSEGVILFFAAGLTALVLVTLAMPLFNDLSAKNFSANPLQPAVLFIFGVSFVVVVLLAGIWPASLLSSFHPIEVFKNQPTGQNKTALFRKGLVVVQFVFSAMLIVGTLTLGRQLNYIQTMNPGYDRENVCVLPLHQMNQHFDAVRAELLRQPGITDVARANEMIIDVTGHQDADWEGKNSDELVLMARLDSDEHFIPLTGIEILQGEGFTGTLADSTRFVVNETAVKTMGMTDPIGKRFVFRGIDGTIAGVVKDFHMYNMHRETGPVVLSRSMDTRSYNRLYVKIAGGKTTEVLADINRLWQQYNADYQFTYRFVDDTFDEMHRSDLRTGKLVSIFSVIAVLISCLGLFGLVTFTAETKTKEIGIRKVLGASVPGIVQMLTREFLILTGIAMAIAFPLAYWWLDRMLQDYAYRISLSWQLFVAAGSITFVLTLLTVGWQAVKAATADPVKSLSP